MLSSKGCIEYIERKENNEMKSIGYNGPILFSLQIKKLCYNKIKKTFYRKGGGQHKMADMSKLMYKLQTALKQKGYIIYINTQQFYSKEQDRLIKVYILKHGKDELLKTASQIKVVKALNEIWQEVKNEEGDK